MGAGEGRMGGEEKGREGSGTEGEEGDEGFRTGEEWRKRSGEETRRDERIQPRSGSWFATSERISFNTLKILQGTTPAHEIKSSSSHVVVRPRPSAPRQRNGVFTSALGRNSSELWRPPRADHLGIKFLSQDIILQPGMPTRKDSASGIRLRHVLLHLRPPASLRTPITLNVAPQSRSSGPKSRSNRARTARTCSNLGHCRAPNFQRTCPHLQSQRQP